METIVFKVEGMSCGHCESRVRKAVGNIAGVESVDVSLQGKTVAVRLDPAVATAGAVRAAIEKAGYDVVD